MASNVSSAIIRGVGNPSDIPPSARGKAKMTLLSCPRCPNDTAVQWLKMAKSYSWCISMSCSMCSDSWFCCTVCEYGRLSRFPDVDRRTRHHNKYHCGQKKSKSSFPVMVSADADEDSNDFPPSHSSGIVDDVPPFSQLLSNVGVAPSGSHLAALGNPCSNRFFHQEVIHRESGIRCLIAKAQFGLPSLGCQLSDDDVDVQLLLADFVFGLTSSQRRIFPELLRKILEMPEYSHDLKQNSVPQLSIGCLSNPVPRLHCKAPLDYRFLRATYVEGSDAVISNLPRPTVTMVSGHSYMSLRAIVAHHLAFAGPQELFCWDNTPLVQAGQPIQSLFESTIAQQAFTEAQAINHFRTTMPILFTKWSDDFEPNSQAKQNRGSAWVCTITFCLPPGCSRPATYILSLGDKELDHSTVENQFNLELNELTSGDQWFYHGGAQSAIRCHIFLLAVLKDQPERRKGCYISLGNGRFSGRWGYSADINETYHFLPSCPECSVRLGSLGVPEDFHTCEQCANWNFNSSLMRFNPPPNFPLRESDAATKLTDGRLSPEQLSFSNLTEASHIARDKYREAEWDARQTISYLSVHGLNTDFCTQLMDSVDRGDDFAIPATWCQVRNLQCLIDVPMHLLGLGISKAIHQSILWVWLLQRRVGSSFSRNSVGKLESVRSMKLSWCKALSAKQMGNLSGWVSENHFAWVRVCRWYCSCLSQLVEDAPYTPPTKALTRYTIKECKEWLRAHGVGYDGLTRVSDLRNRIRNVLVDNPAIDEARVGPSGGVSTNISNVLCCMVKLFALCLGPSVVDNSLPILVERSVKQFLNAVEQADLQLRSNSKPIWYSKYNFLSLLNLPQMIQQFGLPRWYWEGGPAGEGILRHVKPLVNGGLRPGWAVPTHKKYCARMAIQQVKAMKGSGAFTGRTLDENNSDSDDDDFDDATDTIEADDLLLSKIGVIDCTRYPTLDKARWQMRNGRPLSGVVLRANRFFVVVRSRSSMNLHEVVIGDLTHVKVVLGMAYFPVAICPAPDLDVSAMPDDCQDFCMFLPLNFSSALDEMDSAYYAVVTKNWKDLCADGSLRFCCDI